MQKDTFECEAAGCLRKFESQVAYHSHITRKHPDIQEELFEKERDRPESTIASYDHLAVQTEELGVMQQEMEEMLQMSESMIDELELDEQQGSETDQQYKMLVMEKETQEMKQRILKREKIPLQATVLSKKLVLEHSKVTDEPKKDTDQEIPLELLEDCDMAGLKIQSLEQNENFDFKDMKSLNRLNLKDNYISDIYRLGYCYNLEILDLSNNRIREIGHITRFVKLKNLKINDNLLTTLTPMAGLNYLESIEAENNEIVNLNNNLEALAEISSLKELTLKNNPCSKIFSYEYDVNYKLRLRRLDGQRVYEADYEMAQQFKKHFIKKMANNHILLESQQEKQEEPLKRPTTAPSGGRGMRKFIGKLEEARQVAKNSFFMRDGGNGDDDEVIDEKEENLNDSILNELMTYLQQMLKQENLNMEGIIKRERINNEHLLSKVNQLENKFKVQEVQIKTFEPVLLQNKELTRKIDAFEGKASQEETIEFYKQRTYLLTENVNSYLDEIQRLNKLIRDLGGSRPLNKPQSRFKDTQSLLSTGGMSNREKIKNKVRKNRKMDHIKVGDRKTRLKLNTTNYALKKEDLEMRSQISIQDSKISKVTKNRGRRLIRMDSKASNKRRLRPMQSQLSQKAGSVVLKSEAGSNPSQDSIDIDNLEDMLDDILGNCEGTREMIQNLTKIKNLNNHPSKNPENLAPHHNRPPSAQNSTNSRDPGRPSFRLKSKRGSSRGIKPIQKKVRRPSIKSKIN